MKVAAAAPARGGVALPAVFALVLAACGGDPAMRAQGARLSNVPDADPDDYAGKAPVVVLAGKATYYSDSLAGNHTSNGEIYDPSRKTAASRDLPFGSVVGQTLPQRPGGPLVRPAAAPPYAECRR